MFDSAALAAGYGSDRPPVHPRVLERAAQLLGVARPVGRAIDVGCGAGLSTTALGPFAEVRIGIDPAGAMVTAAAGGRGPGEDHFVQASGERLPIASDTCDLVTAAGSLAFADLAPSLSEAARVLVREGALVVYDFGPPTDPDDDLTRWWHTFLHRWPRPPAPTRVTPSGLAGGPLVLVHHEEMVVELAMDLDRYLAYVMTETNVVRAEAAGTPARDVRAWCAATLGPVLDGRRTVPFATWLALLVRPDRVG